MSTTRRPILLAALTSMVPLALPAPTRADNVFWSVDASGRWDTPSNWSSNPAIPGPNDDVTIDRPSGSYTITLIGNQSIHSLLSREPLLVQFGVLNTAATADVAAMTILNGAFIGGTLTGGTINLAPSGAASFNSTTLAAPLTMSDNSTHLTITNNFTLAGGIITDNSGGIISIPGTQSISGSGTITLSKSSSGYFSALNADNMTLGPGVTLQVGSYQLQINTTKSTLTNLGLLSIGDYSEVLGALINQGTLGVTGAFATLDNLAGGGGTIQFGPYGYLYIFKTTTAALNAQTFTGSTGTTSIPQLDNTNSILNLSNGAGFAFGTLTGGTVTGSGAARLAASTLDGVTLVYPISAQDLTIKNAVTLVKGICTANSLVLFPSSKLDLTTSALALQTSSADKSTKLTQLKSAIAAAIANNWTGNGITSSAVAQDPTHYTLGILDNAVLQLATFNGQPVDQNSLILAFAHLGDTNANGIVDIQDQSLITNNWQKPPTTWSSGDLNLDGTVDIQDLTIVTNNWQQSSAFPLAASSSPPVAASFPIPVPEPASLLVLALPTLLFKRRHHRLISRRDDLTTPALTMPNGAGTAASWP